MLDLATCPGQGGGFLLASTSDHLTGRSTIYAYSWHDLTVRKSPKISWSIDQSCIPHLPVDINSLSVDQSGKGQDSTTAGRLFLAGGGPPVGQAGEAANAIKVCCSGLMLFCLIMF